MNAAAQDAQRDFLLNPGQKYWRTGVPLSADHLMRNPLPALTPGHLYYGNAQQRDLQLGAQPLAMKLNLQP